MIDLRVIGSVRDQKGDNYLVVDLPNTYMQCPNCIFQTKRTNCAVAHNREATCFYPLWKTHNVVFTPSLDFLITHLVTQKLIGEEP